MRVVILAAGYGTRLYPLTLKVAKPLIPINRKPIVNFLFDKLKALKSHVPIEETIIVANSKFYKDFLTWRERYQIETRIIDDGSRSPDDRLGAIRDMKLAMAHKKCDWLVLGGDNLFEDNLKEFITQALSKRPYPSVGLYDVRSKTDARRFGVVIIDGQKRIVGFEEKPENPPSTLAASCIYFFPEESTDYLDEFLAEHTTSDAAGTYIAWLATKTSVFGHLLKGEWIDIGHFDSLKMAERVFGESRTSAKKTAKTSGL